MAASDFHTFVISNGGLESINWSPVYTTFNYSEAFNFLYSHYILRVGERDILQAFTQFLPRVLEQSLISGIHPEFNGNSNVYSNHVSFSAHLLENHHYRDGRGKCVEIRKALSGSLIPKTPSILAACTLLNVSRIGLKAVLGKVAGIYSKSLGYQVTVNLVGPNSKSLARLTIEVRVTILFLT